jgi:hypothetical protein
MQLYLLSRKLWKLRGLFQRESSPTLLADRLSLFPFAQIVAALGMPWFVRALLTLLISVSVIVVPLSLLVYAQLKFLPFHDEFATAGQRGAVLVDIGVLIAMWPRIASPTGRWREWWRTAIRRLGRLFRARLQPDRHVGPMGGATLIVSVLVGGIVSFVALANKGGPPALPGRQ